MCALSERRIFPEAGKLSHPEAGGCLTRSDLCWESAGFLETGPGQRARVHKRLVSEAGDGTDKSIVDCSVEMSCIRMAVRHGMRGHFVFDVIMVV